MKLCGKKNWRMGGLFQNICLILLFLLVCVLLYISFFMDRFVVKAQTQEIDRANLQLLQQADDTVVRIVEDLERQVRLFLSDEGMVQHLTNPQNDSVDGNMRLLHNLKNFQEICPEVSLVWVYTPNSNRVLSSDGFLTDLPGSGLAQLMERHRSALPERSAPDMREVMLEQAGQLYVVVDFLPADWLASFVFRLDPDRLAGMLGAWQEWGGILVTDGTGQVLIEGGTLAQSGRTPVALEESSLFYAEGTLQRQSGQRYYRISSDKLGLQFLMEIPPERGLHDRTVLWGLILPALLVLVLLGGGGAYLITRRIYAPINRLMTLVMDRSGSLPAGDSEADYLEAAYQQTLDDNQQLQTRFARLGGDLRNYLCREALQGRLDSGLDAEQLLGLGAGSLYQAAVIKVGAGSVQLQDPIQRKLQAAAAENQIVQMPQCLCCLEQGTGTLVAVFCLPGPWGPEELTGLERQIDAALRTLSEQTKGQFAWDMGTPQNSFLQVRDSYEAAAKNLKYSSYLSGEESASELVPQTQRALEQRLRRIVDQAATGSEPVERYCDRLMEELDGAETGEELRRRCQLVETVLLEKVQFQPDAIPKRPNLGREDSAASVREAFSRFCREALEQGRIYAGKKKFRYVEEAKKYMEERFMDCSLSANEISEHIGISPSYFSSLFNEIQNQSLTSYLNEIRVGQAKNMLAVSLIPVKDVGFRCGFNSASVFGRVFKKHTGVSPKQFRDDCLNRQGGSQE